MKTSKAGIDRNAIIVQLKKKHPTFDDKQIKELLKALIACDPIAVKTNNGRAPYVPTLIKWYLQDRLNPVEDREIVAEALEEYHTLYHQQGKIDKAITDYDSPEALYTHLRKFKGRAKIQRFDLPLIYEDEGIKVYQIDTFEEMQMVSAGKTNWCVNGQQFFNQYGPPFYIIVDRDGEKRLALFHPKTKQLADVYNAPLKNVELQQKVIPFLKWFYPPPKESKQGPVTYENFEKAMSVVFAQKALPYVGGYTAGWRDFLPGVGESSNEESSAVAQTLALITNKPDDWYWRFLAKYSPEVFGRGTDSFRSYLKQKMAEEDWKKLLEIKTVSMKLMNSLSVSISQSLTAIFDQEIGSIILEKAKKDINDKFFTIEQSFVRGDPVIKVNSDSGALKVLEDWILSPEVQTQLQELARNLFKKWPEALKTEITNAFAQNDFDFKEKKFLIKRTLPLTAEEQKKFDNVFGPHSKFEQVLRYLNTRRVGLEHVRLEEEGQIRQIERFPSVNLEGFLRQILSPSRMDEFLKKALDDLLNDEPDEVENPEEDPYDRLLRLRGRRRDDSTGSSLRSLIVGQQVRDPITEEKLKRLGVNNVLTISYAQQILRGLCKSPENSNDKTIQFKKDPSAESEQRLANAIRKLKISLGVEHA